MYSLVPPYLGGGYDATRRHLFALPATIEEGRGSASDAKIEDNGPIIKRPWSRRTSAASVDLVSDQVMKSWEAACN